MGRLEIGSVLIATALVMLPGGPPLKARTSAPWSVPINLGPGINSTANDDGPAISKDELSLYFNSTRPGGSGGQDIWVVQRQERDAPWGTPVNLTSINTGAEEFAPNFSDDGHRMFFVSNRTGGAGGLDLWVSLREDKHDDFGWLPPVNLGIVNSVANDAAPGSSREGNEEVLYLTSNRPGGMGGADIYASIRQSDGSFGPAVAVTELNSPVQDARATVWRARELFLFSPRAGSVGGNDLWTSTRRNHLAAWATPQNVGAIVNTVFDEIQPAISWDGGTLFFASNRPGGAGLLDVYMTTRNKDD